MFTLVKKALKLILSKKQYVYLQKKYWKLKKWHPIKKFKGRILKHLRLAFFYPLLYSFYSKKPIENEKVIFIEPKYEKLSNNFYILHKELTENYDYKIYVHFLREFFCTAAQFRKNCRSLIKDIATAKYVFIDEGSNMMGRIKFRKETQIVQLWHACGAFKKFGFSTAELIFGTTRKEMLTYPHYKYSTLVSVSSPEVIWAYSEAMGIDQTKIQALGVSRTDIFFNEAFKKAAREKFELFMPSSVGKKVILFAPTFRGRVKSAKTATAFSIPQFYEALSDE